MIISSVIQMTLTFKPYLSKKKKTTTLEKRCFTNSNILILIEHLLHGRLWAGCGGHKDG